MAGKLAGKEDEIVQRYEAGESALQLADSYGLSSATIYRILERRQIKRRTLAEARWNELGREPSRPSEASLWEQYAASKSGYPSMSELSRRYGVSVTAVKNWLRDAGIPVRGISKQLKIDVAQKKRSVPRNKGKGHRWTSAEYPHTDIRQYPSAIRRSAFHHRRRIKIHCCWCGIVIERVSSWASRSPRHYCDKSHAALDRHNRNRHGENAVRPLILARLRDLLRELPAHRQPFTEATISALGATIGAQEPEIQAAWQEVREEQETLARVLDARPMLTGNPQPKKPRPKPALSPETLGPVGEAILRAERQEARP